MAFLQYNQYLSVLCSLKNLAIDMRNVNDARNQINKQNPGLKKVTAISIVPRTGLSSKQIY